MDLIDALENYLHSQGDFHLTLILFGLLGIGLIVALFAPPELKLAFIMWWLLP